MLSQIWGLPTQERDYENSVLTGLGATTAREHVNTLEHTGVKGVTNNRYI